MNHLVAIGNRTCDSCIQYQQIHIGSFFSLKTCNVFLWRLSLTRWGMRRQRLRVGSFIKSLTLGVPGSPQTLLWVDWFRQKASKCWVFFAICCAAKVVMWSLFAETGGLWRGDGPPPSNCHRRRRRFHPPASPHDPHCEEEEVAAEVWRWKGRGPQWREPEAQIRGEVHKFNEIRERGFGVAPIIHSESTTPGESHPGVDPNCHKILNRCHWKCCEWPMHNKNSYIIYHLLWIYSLMPCLSYIGSMLFVVRLW